MFSDWLETFISKEQSYLNSRIWMVYNRNKTNGRAGCKVKFWIICASHGLVGKYDFEIWFRTTLNIYNTNTHQTENIFIRLRTWILMGYCSSMIYMGYGLSKFYDYLNFIGPLCFKMTLILVFGESRNLVTNIPSDEN